jgi:hypothetical protein
MTPFLLGLAANFLVELAKSAGHDTGIKVVAAIGPHLSGVAVGALWESIVKRCQHEHAAETVTADLGLVVAGEWYPDLESNLGPPLSPDDPLYRNG